MDEQQLRDYVAKRRPGYSIEHDEAEDLVCYGCAHSASSAPFPGMPSGERPCMTCVRNREDWRADTSKPPTDYAVVVDDNGNARCFDASAGFMYNGAPYPHWPPDNYVTMDQGDRDEFFRRHPDYGKAITFRDGQPVIVDHGDDDAIVR